MYIYAYGKGVLLLVCAVQDVLISRGHHSCTCTCMYLSNSRVAKSACQTEWRHSIPIPPIDVGTEMVEQCQEQRKRGES